MSPTASFSEEDNERDAASDAKRAKTEARLEESERDADWTTPNA
jgi:hypothetical protein